MFDRILSALTVVRHAVAITLVMSAATATVAGSIDVAQGAPVQAAIVKNTNTSDLEATIKACLGTKDAHSVECLDALDKSGLSGEDFWAKLAFSLSDRVAKSTEPSHDTKPETTRPVTGELLGLVTACVESRERSSEACAKALTQSGLTPDEFFAKVSALVQHNDPKTEPSHSAKPETQKPAASPRTEPKPTTKPATTPSVSTAQLEVLVKDCFAKYLAAAAVQGANGSGTAASEACHTAIAASGLSSNDFWAKFGTPTSPR